MKNMIQKHKLILKAQVTRTAYLTVQQFSQRRTYLKSRKELQFEIYGADTIFLKIPGGGFLQ